MRRTFVVILRNDMSYVAVATGAHLTVTFWCETTWLFAGLVMSGRSISHVGVQDVVPPVAGTVPVGRPGMVAVKPGLDTCAAVGQTIVLQFTPELTFRLSWVWAELRVHPDGTDVQVAPDPALNVSVRVV